MKTFLGVSIAAAFAALFVATSADRASASSRHGVLAKSAMPSDISAARRVHRGHRHRHHRPRVYVRGPYRPYYERPTYYVPQGPAPFFPFGFGYGLGPSW